MGKLDRIATLTTRVARMQKAKLRILARDDAPERMAMARAIRCSRGKVTRPPRPVRSPMP